MKIQGKTHQVIDDADCLFGNEILECDVVALCLIQSNPSQIGSTFPQVAGSGWRVAVGG